MAITVQFKHFILQQPEDTKEQNKNLIMSHHQFSKFEKKKEQILILIKTTSFLSSTNSSFPYESKLPQKICEKERFPDANLLFLSYLNNQTKESIERKGKQYPTSNDSTESTQSSSNSSNSSKTLSLSPSLPASASSDSLYRKPNQTHRT